MSTTEAPASPVRADSPNGQASPAVASVQAQTQQPDQYQLRALTAQEVMADASVWMAAAAALTLIVTTVGTILIWRQVRLTRQAVQDTSEATVAMREANEIAENALKNSEVVAQSDLRAWVTIDLDLKACGRYPQFAHLDLAVSLANIGKTPALRVGVSLAAYVAPSVVTNYGELPALDSLQHQMGAMMPGVSKAQNFGQRIDVAAIKAGVAEARKVGFEPMIVVDAIVHYQTVFDAEDAPARLTSIRYHIFNSMQHGPQFQAARMGWLDSHGPAAADQVRFVHHKGAPTYLT